MKLTCLSKGRGFHFPPCHMLDLCGFRILLECPIDLSALTVFAPILTATSAVVDVRDEEQVICEGSSPPKSRRWTEEKEGSKGSPLSKNDLINAVPWYKTAGSLHLWDISLIDVVMVSSPMGMLGLPFLTRNSNFSAKIYATEVTARIGQLMMEDLVSLHLEALQFYGLEEEVGGPEWMRWKELENLPQAMREIVMGKAGEDLGSWLPLYRIDHMERELGGFQPEVETESETISLAEIDECMRKVQPVKYAEESCYNSTLILKAFSSGLEIGAANWMMICPGRSITYLSSSILESANAMEFNYHYLQGNDVILFSDFSSLPGILDFSNNAGVTNSQIDKDPSVSDVPMVRENCNNEEAIKCLADNIETSEELDKLNFICSCVMDTVKGGGSVLIPIGRLGIILQLLEKISQSLESSELKVPIYMISSTAEETLAFTNVVPEWLCNERQEKLYSGLPLFGHTELIKEKRLQIFPVIHSSKLIKTWQEPCIVFSPHWSLRLGPTIHLLRRWHADESCLLILEQGADVDVALLPFMPVAIKVLQCSFLSGIVIHKAQPLLEILKPKIVLFPEDLRAYVPHEDASVSFLYYSENRTLSVPSLSDDLEAFLSVELAQQQEIMAISRFKGKLQVCSGKNLLVPMKAPADLSYKQLHWGPIDPRQLLLSLEKKGIKGSLDKDENASDNDIHSILVNEPDRAVIELSPNKILITASDECLADLIYKAFSSISDAI